MKGPRHRADLVVAGAILFLIGLLQGVVVQGFLNPRMALSAHLTAVQGGLAIMVVGIVWLPAAMRVGVERLSRWSLVGGMYGLWVGLTLSAVTGASEALPIAGTGFHAGGVAERSVFAIIAASSLALIVGWSLFLAGLVRNRDAR